jgi:glycosyltransferase involved in cell wall biosynthesis
MTMPESQNDNGEMPDSFANISVVMAVWRGDSPDQIAAAIDSVLAQTLKPTEFVVVIDGPVDSTIDICLTRYSERGEITLLRLPKNVGRGGARNHAINATLGQWVAIMDADDICCPTRLARQSDFVMRHDVDVLGGLISEFDQVVGDNVSIRKVPQNHDSICRMLRRRSAFNHVTLMFRREIFDQIGGYGPLNYVEDWDFYLRCENAGARFANLDVVLVDVRRALGRRRSIAYFREEMRVMNDAYRRGQFGLADLGVGYALRVAKLFVPIFLYKFVDKHILRRQ